MPHFFIICICHLEYVQHVGCKQKVHSVPEKQQRKTRWASVLRRMCAREKRSSRRNKWLQAHSAQVCAYSSRSCLSKLRLCLAKFLPFFFFFFFQQVCVNVGQSSGRSSSRQAGRTGRLHGICTVTQKDVILMPISGSTTEIVIATMSSTCGRLKIQEKKKPSLSPISGHANKSHLLKNHVLCRTLVLIYQNLALGFNFFSLTKPRSLGGVQTTE